MRQLWSFYYLKKFPPKHSAPNAVNVSFCKTTLVFFKNLTEERLIARCRPIASILKLHPNGAYNPAAYNRLRGHIIVLPQDPDPLLDILPSAELKLHEKIRLIWFGDRPPVTDDLKPYLEVRKQVLYQPLQSLQLNNKLYSRIRVNQDRPTLPHLNPSVELELSSIQLLYASALTPKASSLFIFFPISVIIHFIQAGRASVARAPVASTSKIVSGHPRAQRASEYR
jgi:hypothetical protein